ncbi:MAG: hypothetical protein WC986_05200 [Elusimicrobiota bacterium]|jgi:hypothetical protein
MDNISEDQLNVNRMLNRGVLFSIIWLAGIGSAIAVAKALKARKLIQESNGKLTGNGKVWWCLIVGGLGLLFWVPVMGGLIMSSFH